MNRSIPSTALLVALMSLLGGDALGTPSEAQRYPFDPACAWGRLSDGRGMFVRCLTKEEAERLSKLPPAATGVPLQSARSATSSAPTASPSNGSTTPTPTDSASAVAPETRERPASGSQAATEVLTAELVSVTADDGELPVAKRKLAVPRDRYVQCVAEHGGLKGSFGQVEVRFLVRERGRAEGASAEKFQGMTEAAAACIAQVVHLRQTGTGAGPVTGATAVIRVRRQAR